MKTTITALSLLAHTLILTAQNPVDIIVREAERNNTALTSQYHRANAEKAMHQQALYPENPEISFGHLWGSPEGTGKRNDWSISQHIEFPAIYAYRARKTASLQQQTDLHYESIRKEFQLQVETLCYELIFLNAHQNLLSRRADGAQQLAETYRVKLNLGDGTLPEYNKARLFLLQVRQDAEENELQRSRVLGELTRLNGGIPVELNDTLFPPVRLPSDPEADFRQVVALNPALRYSELEKNLWKQEVRWNTLLTLPALEAGYMSEHTAGEQFRGITLGMTLPLWGNAQQRTRTKMLAEAANKEETSQNLHFRQEWWQHYQQARRLQKNREELREGLQAFNNTALYARALEYGEISLTEYLAEMLLYYETSRRLLEMERDLCQTTAILYQYF